MISLISKSFVERFGYFDEEAALLFIGRIAGVCHSENGYQDLKNESKEATLARVKYVLDRYHFSVFEHVAVSLNLTDFSKILFMILNSLQVYSAAEKSLRYKSVETINDVSMTEADLYEKWVKKLEFLICKEYKKTFSSQKVKSLAQENARYFLSVFSKTSMVYTTNWRQINLICAIFKNFIHQYKDTRDNFFVFVVKEMKKFISQVRALGLCNKKLMRNDKNQKVSFFMDKKDMDSCREIFSEVYLLKSQNSFACMAQEERHRTIKYSILRSEGFYVPRILQKYELSQQWLDDMDSVAYLYPQGSLVNVVETASLDAFIMKLKERLCLQTQLETMERNKKNLERYYRETPYQYIKERLENYMRGARCTFPDYFCDNPCGQMKEGVALMRII